MARRRRRGFTGIAPTNAIFNGSEQDAIAQGIKTLVLRDLYWNVVEGASLPTNKELMLMLFPQEEWDKFEYVAKRTETGYSFSTPGKDLELAHGRVHVRWSPGHSGAIMPYGLGGLKAGCFSDTFLGYLDRLTARRERWRAVGEAFTAINDKGGKGGLTLPVVFYYWPSLASLLRLGGREQHYEQPIRQPSKTLPINNMREIGEQIAQALLYPPPPPQAAVKANDYADIAVVWSHPGFGLPTNAHPFVNA